MRQHALMNTAISISSPVLGSLYLQTLSMFVILFIYYVVFSPFVIDDPIGGIFYVPLGLVHRVCCWAFDICHQALGTNFYNRYENPLSTGNYDCIGQNVHGQYIAQFYAGNV